MMQRIEQMHMFGRKTAGLTTLVAATLLSSGASAQAASFLNILNNTAIVESPADVTDPNEGTPGSNNTSTLPLNVQHMVDLVITKTDGMATYIPGGSGTYTIVVTNAGVTRAEDVTLTDGLPTGLTATAASCTAVSPAVCGTTTIDGTSTTVSHAGGIVPSLSGGSLTIEIDVDYASSLTTAAISNTASVKDEESGDTDAATDDVANGIMITADLAIAKTAGSTTYVPGGTGTYTLTVSNVGPSDVSAARIYDNLPMGVLLDGPWTCSVVSLATCTAASGGAANDGDVEAFADIMDGGSVTISVPVKFDSDAPSY